LGQIKAPDIIVVHGDAYPLFRRPVLKKRVREAIGLAPENKRVIGAIADVREGPRGVTGKEPRTRVTDGFTPIIGHHEVDPWPIIQARTLEISVL
jgi:hypothetical protein